MSNIFLLISVETVSLHEIEIPHHHEPMNSVANAYAQSTAGQTIRDKMLGVDDPRDSYERGQQHASDPCYVVGSQFEEDETQHHERPRAMTGGKTGGGIHGNGAVKCAYNKTLSSLTYCIMTCTPSVRVMISTTTFLHSTTWSPTSPCGLAPDKTSTRPRWSRSPQYRPWPPCSPQNRTCSPARNRDAAGTRRT